jgi:hypothetical protein
MARESAIRALLIRPRKLLRSEVMTLRSLQVQSLMVL